jgi:hypothetical protein
VCIQRAAVPLADAAYLDCLPVIASWDDAAGGGGPTILTTARGWVWMGGWVGGCIHTHIHIDRAHEICHLRRRQSRASVTVSTGQLRSRCRRQARCAAATRKSGPSAWVTNSQKYSIYIFFYIVDILRH